MPARGILMLLLLAAVTACSGSDASSPAQLSSTSADSPGSAPMVRVRVIGSDGQLTGPVEMPKLVLTDAQWQQRLTPEQYRITRNKGTEPAFCGGLLSNKEPGLYVCVGCRLPLFASRTKFESGTGWPSFYEPVARENIREEADNSYGMRRVEILCARCEAHLGHVFEDGPPPTGLRYCLNSESLKFVADRDLATLAEAVPATQPAKSPLPKVAQRVPAPMLDLPGGAGKAEAVFAGGCFWCVEGVFEEVDGVIDAESGYAGGSAQTANYDAVSTGRTGHAEAVRVLYDPAKVSYGSLLRIFFATHDPTTVDRQGPDRGSQYRSAIFYANDEQKNVAQAYIAQLNQAKAFASPVVTRLQPLDKFYPAEEYHQDFVKRNPTHPYIQTWALPKVEKLKESFPEQVKESQKSEVRSQK